MFWKKFLRRLTEKKKKLYFVLEKNDPEVSTSQIRCQESSTTAHLLK